MEQDIYFSNHFFDRLLERFPIFCNQQNIELLINEKQYKLINNEEIKKIFYNSKINKSYLNDSVRMIYLYEKYGYNETFNFYENKKFNMVFIVNEQKKYVLTTYKIYNNLPEIYEEKEKNYTTKISTKTILKIDEICSKTNIDFISKQFYENFKTAELGKKIKSFIQNTKTKSQIFIFYDDFKEYKIKYYFSENDFDIIDFKLLLNTLLKKEIASYHKEKLKINFLNKFYLFFIDNNFYISEKTNYSFCDKIDIEALTNFKNKNKDLIDEINNLKKKVILFEKEQREEKILISYQIDEMKKKQQFKEEIKLIEKFFSEYFFTNKGKDKFKTINLKLKVGTEYLNTNNSKFEKTFSTIYQEQLFFFKYDIINKKVTIINLFDNVCDYYKIHPKLPIIHQLILSIKNKTAKYEKSIFIDSKPGVFLDQYSFSINNIKYYFCPFIFDNIIDIQDVYCENMLKKEILKEKPASLDKLNKLQNKFKK